MIVYRPRLNSLKQEMLNKKFFKDQNEMLNFLLKKHRGAFDRNDIVVNEEIINDSAGWRDSRYVCIKRYYHEDYIKLYGCPKPIGFWASDFDDNEVPDEDVKEEVLHLLEQGIASAEGSCVKSVEDYCNDDEVTITLKNGTQYNLHIYKNIE